MKIQLIEGWRGYKRGVELDMQPNMARFLINAGVAVESKQPRRRRKQHSEVKADGRDSSDR